MNRRKLIVKAITSVLSIVGMYAIFYIGYKFTIENEWWIIPTQILLIISVFINTTLCIESIVNG